MAKKKAAAEQAGQQGKVYGYTRVSTDKQDDDRQRLDIFDYAAKHGMAAPEIIAETISSRKDSREVFGLIARLDKGDVLIVTELSRLARSMIELNGLVSDALKKGASIHVTSNGKPIDGSLESQCLVFALGVAAQVERDMISERTKSALAARSRAGIKLGRPTGKGKKVEQALATKGLTAEYVDGMATAGLSTAKIAKLLDVDARTMAAWLKERGN